MAGGRLKSTAGNLHLDPRNHHAFFAIFAVDCMDRRENGGGESGVAG
jgi:hypothetical protein